MLANTTDFKCPKNGPPAHIKRQMLNTAKINLAKLPMFGLNEHLFATQYLLNWTLGLDFLNYMTSRKSTHFAFSDISEGDLAAVQKVNTLDSELYTFAQRLFLKRLKFVSNWELQKGHVIPKNVANSLTVLENKFR